MQKHHLSRRYFLATLGNLGLLCCMPACLRTQAPLSIAVHPWPGYALLHLARREGWFGEQQARLLDTASATASLQALANGTVDGACLTLDEVLRARASGLPLTVVLVFNVSAGADQILARPGISSIKQLAGTRIGVESSAVGALMLRLTLQAAGLDPSRVTVVPITPDHHHEAWQTQHLDAMVCYEPVATYMRSLGAHNIFDSRSMPGMIVDVLAVRHPLLGRQSAHIRSVVEAHFKALQHLQHNPIDTAYKLSAQLKLPADKVLDAYRGLELPTIGANRRYLTGTSAQLLTTARTLSAIMLQQGLLRQPADLNDLLDPRFLPPKDY